MIFRFLAFAAWLVVAVGSTAAPAPHGPSAQHLLDTAGVTGGLCVMIGCHDDRSAAALATTGRYLVHAVESDATTLDAFRERLQKADLYGLASAESLAPDDKLPYTENLVNAVILGEDSKGRVSLAEVVRVLCPDGAFFAAEGFATTAELTAAGLIDVHRIGGDSPWQCARKPRAEGLGQWSHPRHAANGNAVSLDTLVGPPRRVRWVAGPQQEISNMVTADGRCFFGGVLARDAFNGLRLWEQKLNPSPARGGFSFKIVPGSVRPIATGKSLLVLTDKRLRALDAATGRQLREYPEACLPAEVLVEGRTIVAIDKGAVRAVDLETARLLWKQDAVQARCAVAGDGTVFFVQGDSRSSEPLRLVCRDLAGGTLRWERKDLAWMPLVRQCVYHRGLLVCEISTLVDEKLGNKIQVLSAADGTPLWSHEYIPGSSHMKQARAMFIDNLVWVLEARRCVGLDPQTGAVRKTHPAGSTHCFPPVASQRYLFGGEMDLTNLETGAVDANRITKAACSRDAGVVPANGLIYTFPKHCVCWPMLRDYAALAPARPGAMPSEEDLKFSPERGPANVPDNRPPDDPAQQWPCYRHDAFRSGSTPGRLPRDLNVLWTTRLGDWPEGTIAEDWRANYFTRGPLGPPVVAAGLVYVARPDAHQVVALEASTGRVRWTFTANGRVDTAPTIHRGLCLLGCKSGWVYCLRADNGALVWRLRAAPLDQRIVAYGQLESPWPVPGSVLVIDDVAYFAAGRQPLADGGILVFAVEPASGNVRWVRRIDRVPQTNFYGSSGLEFDNFDLLHREDDAVTMSRWSFDRATGKMTCQDKSGFARLTTGGSGVMFPRGSWSYAPRNESERWKERPYLRPLAVFRDDTLYGCSQDRQTLFRRDFHLGEGEKFDTRWVTYSRGKDSDQWRSQRIARGAAWNVVPFDAPSGRQCISAILLAGDTLCLASAQGRLAVVDARNGSILSQSEVSPPAWDGMAAAEGRLFLSTQDGQLVCLGQKM